jgi:hypothetical protein
MDGQSWSSNVITQNLSTFGQKNPTNVAQEIQMRHCKCEKEHT